MGLDLTIAAVGKVTSEQYETAKAYIEERFPPSKYVDLELTDQGVQYSDLTRFYGEGYERGHWPHIYGLTRVLMKAFPQCDIYHLADETIEDIGPNHCPITETELQKTWDYYLSADGQNYRNKREEFNKGEK